MVSSIVKPVIPQATEPTPVYTLEPVGKCFESYLLWDDTKSPDVKLVGRIGQHVAGPLQGTYWAAPSGCWAKSTSFPTVEAAKAELIAIYESQWAFVERLVERAAIAQAA